MITTCRLIHNLIRREIPIVSCEEEVGDTHSSTFNFDSGRITHFKSPDI